MALAKREILKAIRSALILQGCLAIGFGLAAIFWPGLTALVLVYLFALFLVTDGTILLITGLTYREHLSMPLRAIWGALQLIVGLFLLLHPAVTFTILLVILGVSLFIRGMFSLLHAFTRHGDDPSEHMMHVVLGVLGIIIGAVVLFQPAAGGLAFVWILGLYALVTGIVLLALSSITASFAAKKPKTEPKQHHHLP